MLMCTTLFLRDISACNCVAKTTVDQGDYPKVIPKVGLLLNYKTSEYPLIKEVFFLIHSLQGRHFLSTFPLESFFWTRPNSRSVWTSKSIALHVYTLLTHSCDLARSFPVLTSCSVRKKAGESGLCECCNGCWEGWFPWGWQYGFI